MPSPQVRQINRKIIDIFPLHGKSTEMQSQAKRSRAVHDIRHS